jgi:hypothetical protein
MSRTKPRTVSELMDVANRFADGEDAYQNKRARSPKDDITHRYSSQRRRSRNYDNHNSHNQVAAGFKGKTAKEKSIKLAGTAIEMIRVATDSSDIETMTCHPKNSSTDHAICTMPL